MISDPPVRRDGRCARQGCAKRKPGPSRYAGDAITRDPFCSTECARRFHGCELYSTEDDEAAAERRAEAGRRGRDATRVLA